LSDLHQMRGRVGRSNKKAFCYFICPPYSAMTEDARNVFKLWNNLVSLEADLISRWKIWNSWCRWFIGGEQSGFINEIGFDTYQKNHERRLSKSWKKMSLRFISRRK
jgi:transcription-repair coupling factor (superfamily II helicase)